MNALTFVLFYLGLLLGFAGAVCAIGSFFEMNWTRNDNALGIAALSLGNSLMAITGKPKRL
jgi:hypothetical protein